MSVWYFRVQRADGTKYENGYPDEASANEAHDKMVEEFPERTVEEVVEHPDTYVPLAATANIMRADGSTDVIYNDGSVVNVPAS